MKRKYTSSYALIVLFLFVILLSGCTNKNNHSDNQQLSQKDLDAIPSLFAKNIDVGEFKLLDTNDDGIDDKFILTFKEEEVDDHLFLNKSVTYKKEDNNFNGIITLSFKNTGNQPKNYTHIERIPKSFATHVDDLIFSTPPNKIINPDPEVSWIVNVMKRNIEKITIQAKIAATSAAIKADPGSALSLLSGISTNPTKKMRIAGQEAAMNTIFNNLNDFVAMATLNNCHKFKGSLWNSCIMSLVIKAPALFTESDCEKIDKAYPDTTNSMSGPLLYGMCRAITTKDYSLCHDDMENWREVDLCKHALFASISQKCSTIKDNQKKDECLYNSAIISDSKYGCNNIIQKASKAGCLAEITQESKYCKDINDQEAKKYCCDKLEDGSVQKKCYANEQKQKENEEEEVSCEDKSNDFYKNSCWRSLARKNCDVAICDTNFERIYDKNECIEGVARECGIDHCLAMKDSTTSYNKVSCIYKLATNKNDCALIGNEKYDNMASGRVESQKTCLEKISKN